MGLVRILLALAVAIAHSAPLFGLPFTRLTGSVAAVELFYIISGFYMALVLNRKYVASKGSYRIFLINRILRLYPTYVVVVLATCGWGLLRFKLYHVHAPPFDAWAHIPLAGFTRAFLAVINLGVIGQDATVFLGVSPQGGHLFYTSNFWTVRIPSFRFLLVPQAWTLSIEFLFYLIAPLIVRRRTSVIAVIALCGLALRWVMIHRLGLIADPWGYRFSPAELPLFLFGVLAYKGYARFDPRKVNRLAKLLVYGVVLVTILSYAYLPSVTDITVPLVGFPLLYFTFPLAIPWVFSLTQFSKLDRAIGDLSYPVYMVHLLIVMVLRVVHPDNLGLYACVASIVVAYLLWRFIEQPIDSWRQRLAAAQGSVAHIERREHPPQAAKETGNTTKGTKATKKILEK